MCSSDLDNRFVIFQSDVGGREMYDLFAVSPEGGTVVNLTGTKEASDTSPVAAPDNRTIAYSVRLEKAPATNLAVLDLATRKARVLTHEKDPTRMWTAVAFSADSRTLIANRHDILQSHGEVYRVDVASGKATLVTVKGAKGRVEAAGLSPDGKWLSATVETAAGATNAALVNLASGELRWLKPDVWEQVAGRFSPDGRVVLLHSNVDGRDVTYLASVDGKEVQEVGLPPGINSDWSGQLPAFTPDGSRLLFPHSSGSEPMEDRKSTRLNSSHT